ncbi:MAG: GlmU family protein [Bacteroidales bacterium]|nr:GlmU family protein [Bacteroidales bacterium]
MNIILFDDPNCLALQPFTFTRPVAEIRVGILTIREKWEKWTNAKCSYLTRDYLSAKYPIEVEEENLLIAGSLLPDAELVNALLKLKMGEGLYQNENLLAARLGKEDTFADIQQITEYEKDIHQLRNLPDIFLKEDEELRKDFEWITKDRKSALISNTNLIIGDKENIFVEEGAVIEGAVLNCKEGPIYIGEEAEVMEQATIRGPFALCEHSQVKMSAKIYGATTIGPWCKVGGELGNVVFFGYSNKAHDGFLGNSVVGEWCNFGADTNASNLKNNYAPIKLWNYKEKDFVNTGLQFCGLFMGDHSKCGINSMFNSGTVVGVGCNLFGTGFYKTFVESFSYGGPTAGYERYRLDKAIETATQVFGRRHKEFDEIEKSIMNYLWNEMKK